ncbi:MAG: hypothetical protein JW993_20625 [Sedimentisphaerales bacterium]|nr:hypothetical protein [Sedimentisphaerales bacterium]
MNDSRFSLDEFETLFGGKFASPEELQREYESFLVIVEQMDQAPVPELSAREKADIFRRAWQAPSYERPGIWAWLALLRRPAVTFALGMILGGLLMLVYVGDQSITPAAKAAEPQFAVEHTPYARTYTGKVLQELYPQVENPKVVVEKKQESSPPQRVLYGTLDEGEIYVVWNL